MAFSCNRMYEALFPLGSDRVKWLLFGVVEMPEETRSGHVRRVTASMADFFNDTLRPAGLDLLRGMATFGIAIRN